MKIYNIGKINKRAYYMRCYQLLKEKNQEINKLNAFFNEYKKSSEQEVIELFKTLIKYEYQESTFVHQCSFDFESNQIKIYLIIRSNVPTDEDFGIVYRIDAKHLSSEELTKGYIANNILSGDTGYLSI